MEGSVTTKTQIQRTAPAKPSKGLKGASLPSIPTTLPQLADMLAEIRSALRPVHERFKRTVGLAPLRGQEAKISKTPTERRTVSRSSAEEQTRLNKLARQAISGGIEVLAPGGKLLTALKLLSVIVDTPNTKELRQKTIHAAREEKALLEGAK